MSSRGNLVALSVWAMSLSPMAASAQDTGAAPVTTAAPAEAKSGAESETPGGRYAERVLGGLRQIVLRDFDGALATLRAAAQLEPASPAAFCHLGDAQLGKENWAEARAAYESCARFATLAKDARYATLAAVGNARTAELSKASLTERRDAYLRLSAATSDGPAKAMAQERLGVLEALLANEPAYVEVQKRIAERAAKADEKPAK